MSTPTSQSKPYTLPTPLGPITGTLDPNFLIIQGLHYATAPRFQPPIPITTPWTELKVCTQPGPSCPQAAIPYPPFGDTKFTAATSDEDCLRVNIVAPASLFNTSDENGAGEVGAGRKAPVLLWIHGGAYITGSADLGVYDTRGLAARGIVVVSVQYRLGILGYAEIEGVCEGGNLGLRDQIEALKWVRENVGAFGGDAEDVTIMGESAGGDSVYSLLVCEGTVGLFRRAVMMSGTYCQFDNQPRKELKAVTKELVVGKGRDWKTMSTEEVMEVQAEVFRRQLKQASGQQGFSPSYDKAPFLTTEEEKTARFKELAKTTTVLVGSTKEDALPFVLMHPGAIQAMKIPMVGPKIVSAIGRAATWSIFVKPMKDFQKRYLSLGGDCSIYRIDYAPAGSKYRAGHAIELAFIFGEYTRSGKLPILNGIDQETYEALSREIKNVFEAFVKGQALPKELITVDKGFVHTIKSS